MLKHFLFMIFNQNVLMCMGENLCKYINVWPLFGIVNCLLIQIFQSEAYKL